VLDFQKNAGLVMDGMVDASVMKVMDKVTKDGEPHSNEAKIPDRNGGYARGRALSQLTVAIDPGHGGDDPGIETDGMVEKELNLEAGKRLARMLSASGADVLMTRDMDQRVPLYERPAAANHAGADVFISIHQNGNRNPMAQGATAYYFSRQGYYSEAGRVLAGIIVESIGRGMGLPVLPVMGRNYAVLRETEMTAVLVEPLFITASGMGEKEGQDDLAAREAEAIFQGIKDYFE
jgi:N-acetylmuramoyl-L-alanine amidase